MQTFILAECHKQLGSLSKLSDGDTVGVSSLSLRKLSDVAASAE